MLKRPVGLAEAVNDDVSAKKPFSLAEVLNDEISAGMTTSAAQPPKPTKHPRPTTREGARGVTVWVDKEVFRALKRLAADEDKNMQQIMFDAINALFRSHKMARIAGPKEGGGGRGDLSSG
jgi:hypothetical protein